MDTDLGSALRRWRDRMTPEDVGLPVHGARRAPGLRREELAVLAGVSVEYVIRLEQGRAQSPSAQVLGSLARALRLTADERDHLFRLAGQSVPTSGRIRAHLTPGVQRLLRSLDDTPIAVFDAAWTLVAWTSLWAALLGEPADGRDRNLAWAHFTGRPSRVVRRPADTAAFEAEMVGDLRSAVARFPDDTELHELVDRLRGASARFEELWSGGNVTVRSADRKTIAHPEVGELTVDCDVLTVEGADLRVVAYSAEPGTEDAERLALVRVVGLQTMSR
ncbi:helix-turn-helix transcriptional regulator [Cellulomonas sp. 73-92]|uniref:helix-turn-helix domain-containing protein n=1 Tax=Cellulomonas sp. 73-92 TaxID=1895740 RepID=UPI000AEF68A2|nr:helix-turn-helix transcriptional regulator [Cellulomonas sp. 73-92]